MHSTLFCATSLLSRSTVPAATIPTSQTPNESAQYATRPVENCPPSASPPGHTLPTADPHRSAAQAGAHTSPSHPPCARSTRDTSPSRSCTPETHPHLPEDRPLLSVYRIAVRIHPSSAASRSPPPFRQSAGHPSEEIPPVQSAGTKHPVPSSHTPAQSCSIFY